MPKGHLQNIPSDTNIAVDPFGNNVAASQVYKAMERLVTATYMVTNLVPNTESLKVRIRDIVNSLLEDTLRLRRGFNSLGSDTIKDIVAKVRLTMSLLDALYTAGLISKMNLRVLKGAFASFSQRLISMSEATSADGVELTEDYFNTTTQPDINTNTITSIIKNKVNKRDNKNMVSVDSKSVSKQSKTLNSTPKAAKVRINNIIEFITKRGSASTGDLTSVVSNCSSKTLQRDLNNLVQQNILKREGTKRWTRYSIA